MVKIQSLGMKIGWGVVENPNKVEPKDHSPSHLERKFPIWVLWF